MQPQNPAIRPPKSPKPDVVALASRFVEPLTTEDPPAPARPAPAGPRVAASAPRFTGRPWGTNAQPDQTMAPAGPGARRTSGPPINVLISALVVIALVPSAILFVPLWQYMMRPHSVTLPVTGLRTAETARPAGLDYPKKVSARFEVADGDNAPSFADVEARDGTPGSAGGWSFASEDIGALPLAVPEPSSLMNITAAPDVGDGPVPAQPTLQPSMAPSPAGTEMADATGSKSSGENEGAAQSQAPAPLPQRKPTASAGTAPTVRTVKVVTIAPPPPTRPHDGAYALGSPADEASAEWMVTKTAVDMHAKALQSSETVRVAEGGIKMRVTARDKNWIQVTDPATSTTGWIYNRFLQPTDPPAQ